MPNLYSHGYLISRWQHHAAAIGVFLVWGELMLMIGRLPTFGIYVQMFTTVAKNFSKFLAAYFCLLVAFALSFSVLFPNYQSFNVNPPAAIVKTLVMMAGEIEYENFIYENGNAIYDVTGHVMIMIFVVLVSIILMNLLVGLAVSDIQVCSVVYSISLGKTSLSIRFRLLFFMHNLNFKGKEISAFVSVEITDNVYIIDFVILSRF